MNDLKLKDQPTPGLHFSGKSLGANKTTHPLLPQIWFELARNIHPGLDSPSEGGARLCR